MKKVFIAIIICAYLALLSTAGYCQYTERDDSAIEQTESQMGQSLDSEISSGQSQGQSEMDSANEDMNTGTGVE